MLLTRLRRVSVCVVVTLFASALLLDEASATAAGSPSALPNGAGNATTTQPTPAPTGTASPLLPVGSEVRTTGEISGDSIPSNDESATTDGAGDSVPRSPVAEEFPVDPSAVRSSSPKDEVVLKPPKQTRWLLLGAGLATTAAWYGAGYGIGALWPDAPGRNDLRIPVAGPFMDLAKTGCPAGESGCSTFELVVRTLLVSLDAVGQAGGIALMLEGALFSPSGIEPPRSSSTQNQLRQNKGTSVVAIPWSDGKSGAGIGLVGSF